MLLPVYIFILSYLAVISGNVPNGRKCKTSSGDSRRYISAQDLSESVRLYLAHTFVCRRKIKFRTKHGDDY